MTIPIWVLLGFAGWTLLVLLLAVGGYRWRLIFTGTAAINAFEPGSARGADWYERAQRAHANCLENLPVYTALVVTLVATGAQHPAYDALALALLPARIAQTVTHIGWRQTSRAVAVRFTLFSVQFLCMVAIGCLMALGVGART